MKIIGDTKPLTGKAYEYTLLNMTVQVVVKEWKIEYNGRVLSINKNGIFKFSPEIAGKTLKLIAVIIQGGREVYHSISLTVLAGKPEILSLEWQDFGGKPVGTRKVGYLDKIRLAVKTHNIPKGDSLKVTVYEEDLTGDRIMNTSVTTSGVARNGFTYLYFNNLSLYQAQLNKMDNVDESEHEYYVKIQYSNHVSEVYKKVQLVIQNELKTHIDTRKAASNPVVVGRQEPVKREAKIPVNFTFGVFIDGTLNNMYNTELKQKTDGKPPRNATGLVLSDEEARKVYDKKGDKSYHESSYENDLSNPAILFKNYIPEKENLIFSIYTEGIGTNSFPEEQGKELKKEDYRKDDVMEGPAFGMGSAGIKDKVRKSIKDVVKKIKENTAGKKDIYVDSVTFDVFGFSRGAAAARHFVHVTTYPAYASLTETKRTELVGKTVHKVEDQFGYALPERYAHKMMPRYGYLGQLLKEAGLLDDQTKVNVRFVGIYDTVPHHGGTQKNDKKDLGLDSVNKAQYVVHMIAADEHRFNFDLVDISSVVKTSPENGKKGGIELIYPGVHCDVGGAYVEGDGNHPYRVDVGRSKVPLEELKKEIVAQGWFKEQEMSVNFYYSGIILAGVAGNFYRLEGFKEHVSNQYSYIPLHIMAEFCRLRKIPIDQKALISFKDFSKPNTAFLEGIKDTLWKYSFHKGKPLSFIEPKVYREPPIVYASGDSKEPQYRAEWEKRQKEGQIRLNREAEKENEDLKKLRYHYLHWNSSYGSPEESMGTFASGKNKPNIINGKRKRDVY